MQQDTYIHSYTSLDGAFGGSLSAVLSVGTKAGWLSQYFPVDNIQELIQSYPSVVWLLPLEQVSFSLCVSVSVCVCMVYITWSNTPTGLWGSSVGDHTNKEVYNKGFRTTASGLDPRQWKEFFKCSEHIQGDQRQG